MTATNMVSVIVNFQERGAARIQKTVDGISNSIMRMDKRIMSASSTVAAHTSRINTLGISMNILKNRIAAASDQFQAWMMSVMFGGMMLKNIFQSIAVSATKTFNDIMNSSDMMGTALQMVNAQWEFLKFTIGSAISQALEPLLPLIERIITRITDWIREHPKLTAGIIGVGFALGTLLFIGGSLGLFVLGLIKGFRELLGVWRLLSGLVELNLSPAFQFLGKWLIYIYDAAKVLGQALWNSMKIGWQGLSNFVVAFPKLSGAIAGIITLIAYFGFKWKWNWKAMFVDATTMGLNILKWMVVAVEAIVGFFEVMKGMVQDIFASMINWIIDKINWMIGKLQESAVGKKVASMFGLQKIPIDATLRTDNAQRTFQDIQWMMQQTMNSFDTKIGQWSDVRDAWAEELGLVTPGAQGMGEFGEMPSMPTGALPDMPSGSIGTNVEEQNLNFDGATFSFPSMTNFDAFIEELKKRGFSPQQNM